jgi:hypothetical protein
MVTPVARALVPGALIWCIRYPPPKPQRIYRANRDTGSAVIALLAKIITQWVKSKLTNAVAFGAIIAGHYVPLDTKHPESPQQGIQRAARTKVTTKPTPCDQQIE